MVVNYYRVRIFNSDPDNGVLVYETEAYTNLDALYAELRDGIDEIGKTFEETDDCASYLGDVAYEAGREYCDEEERWDFNKKTLTEWIEILITTHGVCNSHIEAYIVQKQLRNVYDPEVKSDKEYNC